MTSPTRKNWLIPTGLIVLTLVPAAAGSFRVAEIMRGGPVSADNARFFAMPMPTVLHILSSLVFGILGALQFSPGLRAKHPAWHRRAGRLLVLCGLLSAGSGLYLSQVFPHVPGDGPTLYYIRLAVGTLMLVSIVLGFAAIHRRDISSHQAWITRGYALGMGAGTQVFTHLPWFIFVGAPSGLARDGMMFAGWAINLAIAEWIIRRRANLLQA